MAISHSALVLLSGGRQERAHRAVIACCGQQPGQGGVPGHRVHTRAVRLQALELLAAAGRPDVELAIFGAAGHKAAARATDARPGDRDRCGGGLQVGGRRQFRERHECAADGKKDGHMGNKKRAMAAAMAARQQCPTDRSTKRLGRASPIRKSSSGAASSWLKGSSPGPSCSGRCSGGAGGSEAALLLLPFIAAVPLLQVALCSSAW